MQSKGIGGAVTGVRSHPVLVRTLAVVAFALLTGLSAQVRIPVSGTPVPVTLQTACVLLAGMTLGPWLGLASMGLYLLLGMTGYHVFAAASWGAGTVFGTTGGYLIGFVLAQPLVGFLTQRGRGRFPGILAAGLAGSVVIYVTGLVWLQLWMQTSLSETLAMGLWPFVPWAVIKLALAVTGGRLLHPVWARLADNPR